MFWIKNMQVNNVTLNLHVVSTLNWPLYEPRFANFWPNALVNSFIKDSVPVFSIRKLMVTHNMSVIKSLGSNKVSFLSIISKATVTNSQITLLQWRHFFFAALISLMGVSVAMPFWIFIPFFRIADLCSFPFKDWASHLEDETDFLIFTRRARLGGVRLTFFSCKHLLFIKL